MRVCNVYPTSKTIPTSQMILKLVPRSRLLDSLALLTEHELVDSIVFGQSIIYDG